MSTLNERLERKETALAESKRMHEIETASLKDKVGPENWQHRDPTNFFQKNYHPKQKLSKGNNRLDNVFIDSVGKPSKSAFSR